MPVTVKPTKPISYYIGQLERLTHIKYGRHRIERLYGEELAEDIAPLLDHNFSCIKELEEKYKYLEWYHDMKHAEYRKMPLELRRIKEETSSFMCDKMCYFSQIYENIKRVKELCRT